jgi:hypothetical protein
MYFGSFILRRALSVCECRGCLRTDLTNSVIRRVCVFICTLGERVWGRCGSTLAEKALAAGVQIKSRGVAQVQMIAERASQSHSLSAVAAFDLVAKNSSWQLLNGMYDPC